jgi:integrase
MGSLHARVEAPRSPTSLQTCLRRLAYAGVPEAVVMEMVGHDSEQMSAHYTHVGREALEKAASSLPDLG